jgi:hypothetical protein
MVKRWSIGLAYCVVGDFLSPAPSVKYHQYYRAVSLHLGSPQSGEYTFEPGRILINWIGGPCCRMSDFKCKTASGTGATSENEVGRRPAWFCPERLRVSRRLGAGKCRNRASSEGAPNSMAANFLDARHCKESPASRRTIGRASTPRPRYAPRRRCAPPRPIKIAFSNLVDLHQRTAALNVAVYTKGSRAKPIRLVG